MILLADRITCTAEARCCRCLDDFRKMRLWRSNSWRCCAPESIGEHCSGIFWALLKRILFNLAVKLEQLVTRCSQSTCGESQQYCDTYCEKLATNLRQAQETNSKCQSPIGCLVPIQSPENSRPPLAIHGLTSPSACPPDIPESIDASHPGHRGNSVRNRLSPPGNVPAT